MRTLIIMDTSQRVKILSGKVMILSTGETVLFTIASTTATIKAVTNPSIFAPGVR